MNSFSKNIVWHVIGSLLFLLLPVVMNKQFEFVTHDFFHSREFVDLLSSIVLLVFFYAHYYKLIPTYYFQKKYLQYSFFVFFSFVIVILPKLATPPRMQQDMHNNMPHREPHRELQGRPHFELDGRRDEPHFPHRHPPYIFILWVEMRQNIFLFVAILFASLAYRINDQWKQVKKEKLQAELSYLKAQINPHFLFNTLNSIYSLALLKSNKTPEAIVKLSSMMRYVMHEATEKYVSLESELNYIQSYIDLQKIRLDETASVVYETEIEIGGKKIAPLILIPFIENAFKHGVNPEVNSSIIITLKTKDDTLTLYVYNLKVPHSQYSETKSGYGLANAKQQLNLLYPDKHSLYLQNEADHFSVSLTLDLQC